MILPEEIKDPLRAKFNLYVIQGAPIPLARHRHSYSGRIWDEQKQLKLALKMQLVNQHDDAPFLEGPLLLDAIFVMPMPKKAARSLNGSHHYIKPDTDNLLKMLMDIATGILYKDDCSITHIDAAKVYGTEPCTIFKLTELRKIKK